MDVGDQGLQRLPFAARAWGRGSLAREHASGRTNRVERVGLAARAALAPQPSNLEHPFAAAGQEACETGTERACPLDRESTTAGRVLFREQERLPIAVAACHDGRLEHDRAGTNVHDRQRMGVAVRVNTNDVVQLICEHAIPTSSRALGDTSGVGLG